MNRLTRTLIACVTVALISVAAASNSRKHLTLQRVLALTAPVNTPPTARYRVEVSGLGSVVLSADKPTGQVEMTRELIFPDAFEVPHRAPAGDPVPLVPSTPTNFDKINVGWTVRLSAKPQGKLLAICGAADYVEANLVPSGYGVVAGPIYVDGSDEVLTPNNINEPRSLTTTTRFQLFALPGEAYDVAFYRGAKTERHLVTVSEE